MHLNLEELRLIEYVHPIIANYEKSLKTRGVSPLLKFKLAASLMKYFESAQAWLDSKGACLFFGIRVYSLLVLLGTLGAWAYFATAIFTFNEESLGRDPEIYPVFTQAPWIYLLATICFASSIHIMRFRFLVVFLLVLGTPQFIFLVLWILSVIQNENEYYFLVWVLGIVAIQVYSTGAFFMKRLLIKSVELNHFYAMALLVFVHGLCTTPICRNLGVGYLHGAIRSQAKWVESIKPLILLADIALVGLWTIWNKRFFFLDDNGIDLLFDKMRSIYLKSASYRLHLDNFLKLSRGFNWFFDSFDIIGFLVPILPLICSQTVYLILLFNLFENTGNRLHAENKIYFVMTILAPAYSFLVGAHIAIKNVNSPRRILTGTFLLMVQTIGGTVAFAFNKKEIEAIYENGFYQIVLHPILVTIVFSYLSSFGMERRRDTLVMFSFATFFMNSAIFMMGLSDILDNQVYMNVAYGLYIAVAVAAQPFIFLQFFTYIGALSQTKPIKNSLIMRKGSKDIMNFGFVFNSFAFCIIHTLITYNYLPELNSDDFSLTRKSFYMTIIILLPPFWICLHFSIRAKFPQNIKKHIISNTLILESIVKGKNRGTVTRYRVHQSIKRLIFILIFVTSVPLISLYIVWEVSHTGNDDQFWNHFIVFIGGSEIILGFAFYFLTRIKYLVGTRQKLIFPLLILLVWTIILIPVFCVYPLVGLLFSENDLQTFNEFQSWSYLLAGILFWLIIWVISVLFYGFLFDIRDQPKICFLIGHLQHFLKVNHVAGDSKLLKILIELFEKQSQNELQADLLQNSPFGWVRVGEEYPDLAITQVLVPKMFFWEGIVRKGKAQMHLKSRFRFFYVFFGDPEDDIQTQEEFLQGQQLLQEQQKLKEEMDKRDNVGRISNKDYFKINLGKARKNLKHAVLNMIKIQGKSLKKVAIKEENQEPVEEEKEKKPLNEEEIDVSVSEVVANLPIDFKLENATKDKLKEKPNEKSIEILPFKKEPGQQVSEEPNPRESKQIEPKSLGEIPKKIEKENQSLIEEKKPVPGPAEKPKSFLPKKLRKEPQGESPIQLTATESERFASSELDYLAIRSSKTRLLKKIDPCPMPNYDRVWESIHGKLMIGSHLYRSEFVFRLFIIFATQSSFESQPSVIYVDFLEMFRMVVWRLRFMPYLKQHVSFWKIFSRFASVRRKLKNIGFVYMGLSFQDFKQALWAISQIVYMNDGQEKAYQKLLKKIYAEFMELSEINGFLSVYKSEDFLEELKQKMEDLDLEKFEKQLEDEAKMKPIDFEDDDSERIEAKKFLDALLAQTEKNYRSWRHSNTSSFILCTRVLGKCTHRALRLICVDLFEKLPLKIKFLFGSCLKKKDSKPSLSPEESKENNFSSASKLVTKKSFANEPDGDKNKIMIRSSAMLSRMNQEENPEDLKKKRKEPLPWPVFVSKLLENLNEASKMFLSYNRRVNVLTLSVSNVLLTMAKIYEFGFLIQLVFSDFLPWFDSKPQLFFSTRSFFKVYSIGFILGVCWSILVTFLCVVSIPDIIQGRVGQSKEGKIMKFPHPRFLLSRVLNILAAGLFTTFIRELFMVFSCTENMDGEIVLKVNNSFECFTELQYNMVIMTILLLVSSYTSVVLIYPNFQYMDGSLNFKFEPKYLAIAFQVKAIIVALDVLLPYPGFESWSTTTLCLLINALLYLGLAILVFIWRPTIIKSSCLLEGFGLLCCCWSNLMAILLLLTNESLVCLILLLAGIGILLLLWLVLFIWSLRKERKVWKEQKEQEPDESPNNEKNKLGTEEDFMLKEDASIKEQLVPDSPKDSEVALLKEESFSHNKEQDGFKENGSPEDKQGPKGQEELSSNEEKERLIGEEEFPNERE